MATDITTYRGGRDLAREEHRVAAVLRREQLPAKRAAARLQGGAFVASVAMTNIAILTGLEAQMAKKQGAAVDARVGSVVDTYTSSAINELLGLSLRGE